MTNPFRLLEGKVAIVTGAGGGIGREHALALASYGAKVVINDIGGSLEGVGRSRNVADAVVEEIKAAGGEAIANYDSVATREGVDRLMFVALDHFKGCDIIINNAGMLRRGEIADLTEDDFDAVYNVHLRGTFLCTQTFMRHVRARGIRNARIINTTDLSGLIGTFGQSNYGAMKAAIVGFTKGVAVEVAAYGATCNAIAPMALTRMTRDLPLFRGATEELMGAHHISPAVVFLASELAAHVNGKILGIQGPKLFEFQVRITEGVVKDNGTWTPDEIASRWDEITR